MSLKKQKPRSRPTASRTKRKPSSKRVPLAKQVAALRRELREVTAQRDAFAREIARLTRPEIDEILKNAGDLLQYVDAKPTMRELLDSLESTQ